MEQQCVNFPLSDWCVLAGEQPKLGLTNRILDILQTAWRKNYSQLVPTLFPLANFVYYPAFQEVIKLDNYGLWQREALDKFGNLGTGRRIYTKDVILQRISNTGHADFQYRQVNAFILALMKRGSVFRPLTSFKILLSLTDRNKLLPKLYKIL